MRKILVTGSAGFIGFYVAKHLLEKGDKVVGLDNLNDYYDVNLKRARLAQLTDLPAFGFVKMDLVDGQVVMEDRRVVGVDEAELRQEVRRRAKDIVGSGSGVGSDMPPR